MKCSQVIEWLRRDLAGDGEPSAEAAAHLERCPDCAKESARLKALSEGVRLVLPEADVPHDFAERVMATLVPPTQDRQLAEAARPHIRRVALIALVVVAVPMIAAFVPRRGSEGATGSLRVERGGVWIAGDEARPGELFRLPAGELAQTDPVHIEALEEALLRAPAPRSGRVLQARAGWMLLRCDEPTVVETPLAEIRLEKASLCAVLLGQPEETEMKIAQTPAVAVVAMLAGSATVACAQGQLQAAPQNGVAVDEEGKPEHLREILERLERLEKRLAAQEKSAVDASVDLDGDGEADLVLAGTDVRPGPGWRLHGTWGGKTYVADREGNLYVLESRTGRLLSKNKFTHDGPVRVYDYDHDGDMDLFIVDEDGREHRLEQTGELRFREVAETPDIERLIEAARRGDEKARAELRELMQRIEAGLKGGDRQRMIGTAIKVAAPALNALTSKIERWLDAERLVVMEDQRRRALELAQLDRRRADDLLERRAAVLDFLADRVRTRRTLARIERARVQLQRARQARATGRVELARELEQSLGKELDALFQEIVAGEAAPDPLLQEPMPGPRPQGVVLRVRGALVLMSVGSNDGVRVGDDFTVARGHRYVGRLRVVKVEKDSAVGRFSTDLEGAVAKEADRLFRIDGRELPGSVDRYKRFAEALSRSIDETRKRLPQGEVSEELVAAHRALMKQYEELVHHADELLRRAERLAGESLEEEVAQLRERAELRTLDEGFLAEVKRLQELATRFEALLQQQLEEPEAGEVEEPEPPQEPEKPRGR